MPSRTITTNGSIQAVAMATREGDQCEDASCCLEVWHPYRGNGYEGVVVHAVAMATREDVNVKND